MRRAAALVVTIGILLSLSACGNSVPAVVATYKATFVVTPAPTTLSSTVNDFYVDPPHSVYSLVLRKGGHFAMTPLDDARVTFNGTWSESNGFITLNTPEDQFIAQVKGRDLRRGQVGSIGSMPTYTVTWSAVRT